MVKEKIYNLEITNWELQQIEAGLLLRSAEALLKNYEYSVVTGCIDLVGKIRRIESQKK